MDSAHRDVDAARRFNRFYTKQIGLLNDRLLQTPYTLTEGRLMFEIAHQPEVTASDLSRDLGLDPGYLSRTLRKLERKGLIDRTASQSDGRRQNLSLSKSGQEALADIDTTASREVGAMLAALPAADRSRMVDAMTTIETVLDKRQDHGGPIVLRPHRPGDMGWIVHRHAVLYVEEFGFDEAFEAVVADIAAAFLRNYDPTGERCWVAERGSQILGSVFIVRQSETVAKLRMLYVEPEARGTGLGRQLVREAVTFARLSGYKSVVLQTASMLDAARNLYRNEGFRLVEEQQERAFGEGQIVELWRLDL